MANIRKMPSGSWQAAVYVGKVNDKKKYEYITKATRQECKAAAAALETEVEQGKYVVISSSITLGEAMDKHNESVASFISPTTVRSYLMYARSSFKELRDKPLKRLKAEDIQLHYATNRGHLKPKSIRNEHAYLSFILKKYLGRKSPCDDVILPKKSKYLYKTLSDKQVSLLLNNIKGIEVEIPILLAIWCGLRQGEIIGLRWKDIDFENNLILVEQTKIKGLEGYEIKPPKSYAGIRQIHLPAYIEEKIRARDQNKNSKLIFNKTGNQIYTAFKKVLKINNLPDIRFHDLRHMCATIMLSEGIPELYTSEVLGHSITGITKRYQHVRTKEKKKYAEIIDNYFMSKIRFGPEIG